ncbi:Uncharacterised protein [uncultured archaeon]|nr:Uncharacterised protein [uncultured archaeon]
MNFPVGTVVSKGETPYDFVSKAQELAEKSFNGYIVQAVCGHLVEEGVIFFREGEMIGCVVECLAADKTLKGNEAREYFFNEVKGMGFYHCIELTRSQVDLVMAFDEKILGDKINLKELAKLIPSAFTPKFERTSAQKSALEVYGLGDLK